MKRKAAIDIGTNSVRLLVADFKDDFLHPIFKTLETTRLGAGVDKNRILSDISMENTIQAVKKFRDKALSIGAEDITAIATSAVRDAGNGSEFTRFVEGLGLELKVLSGNKEAELGFCGAVIGCSFLDEKVVVVDIGGGSTELIYGENLKPASVASMDLGAVRLTERFIDSDPINAEQMRFIRDCVVNELQKRTYDMYNIRGTGIRMIGIGGTITTVAAIALQLDEYKRELIHGCKLSRHIITDILERLSAMTLDERKRVAGLQPGRADIIVAGILILDCVMCFWNKKEIYVSEWDNLEGAVYHQFVLPDKITD